MNHQLKYIRTESNAIFNESHKSFADSQIVKENKF